MRRTTPEAIMQDHRSDPDRNTGEFREDELRPKSLSPTKIGLWSPRTRYKRGGLVGWFDLTEQLWNELNDTRSAALPRQSRNRVYHRPYPEFDGAPVGMQCHPGLPDYYRSRRWTDYFRGYVWTDRSPDRFPRSNWGNLDSTYTVQPDFVEAEADEWDPSNVHERQAGLDDYGDVSACCYAEVRQCDCCRCPECDSVAIRARKTRVAAERYACGNPSCDAEPFEAPTVKPTRRGD